MQLSLLSSVKLNNGVAMPVFGLGVYLMEPGRETYTAVKTALHMGYRLIDTASLYNNEKDVGAAVRDSGIPRGEIFVTTKLWNEDQGYETARKAFDRSLKRLGFDYVDLYLVHFPVPGVRTESWRALEKIRESGRARAVGVSNYTTGHLNELLGLSYVVPAVNQVEFSPFLYQRELLEFCKKRRIQVEAYAPLTAGLRLNDPRVADIARKYHRTNAQILLRWGIEHGLIVIPKSSNPARLAENSQIFDFELAAEDISALNGLHEGFRSSWDPTAVP